METIKKTTTLARGRAAVDLVEFLTDTLTNQILANSKTNVK